VSAIELNGSAIPEPRLVENVFIPLAHVCALGQGRVSTKEHCTRQEPSSHCRFISLQLRVKLAILFLNFRISLVVLSLLAESPFPRSQLQA
jgi:hypothetical protein